MPLSTADRRRFWLGVAVVWAIALTIATALTVQDGREARDAICSFKLNLLLQIDSSDRWLALHPKGAPALGITAADIRASIARQQATVRSLRIDCNLPPIPRVPPSPVPTTTTERTTP